MGRRMKVSRVYWKLTQWENFAFSVLTRMKCDMVKRLHSFLPVIQ